LSIVNSGKQNTTYDNYNRFRIKVKPISNRTIQNITLSQFAKTATTPYLQQSKLGQLFFRNYSVNKVNNVKYMILSENLLP